MSVKNPKLVINGFKTQCEKKAQKVDDFIQARKTADTLDKDDVLELKKMNTALENQFAHMELKWESSRDEIEDETVLGDFQRVVNSSEDYVDKMLKASKDFIIEKSS